MISASIASAVVVDVVSLESSEMVVVVGVVEVGED
jgi:hypothetical protein